MADRINVLLMGGGGREHAIADRLTRSPRLGQLWITHGQNPGLAALGRVADVPVAIRESYRLVQFCDHHDIGLVVIGPEEPLAEGFADKLRTPTRKVFGPGADGARIEADKAWAKQLMRGASIPTAEARVFTDADGARTYLRSREHPPVIKASGLAKGKGVFVPDSLAEALDAIDRIMVQRVFGDAGREVVIEERLTGSEVSVLALVDGRSIYVLETAQDHKRLGDRDSGPNTGGMGAFTPSTIVDEATMAKIQSLVLVPALDALRRDGIDFRGVLYAGIMLTHAGPKVLEFNCRFGDPECQAILVRLKSDLLELMLATCDGKLADTDVEWEPGASCCVVLAAEGYPEKPKSGAVIHGLDAAAAVEGVTIYHAGTTRARDGTIVTAGGRVLGVTAVGADLEQARRRAYAACDLIVFAGKTYRTDIGIKAAPTG
ncbi:MAG: phosphoribosylamine--glycine ligase [Phycisphaerales bacterium]